MGAYGLTTREFLLAGSPTALLRESFGRDGAGVDNAIAATGVMHCTAVPLLQGDTIAKVTFVTGATAASTPTHSFVALYGPWVAGADPVLQAQSADKLTTAMAANTVFTWSLTTAFTVATTGTYFVALSQTGTTICTVLGKSVGLNATAEIALLAYNTGFPPLASTSGTALAGTPPATHTSITYVTTPLYFILL